MNSNAFAEKLHYFYPPTFFENPRFAFMHGQWVGRIEEKMMNGMEEIFILIAEDDADDRFLLQAAFEENGFEDQLHFLENGLEVIEYLKQCQTHPPSEMSFPRFVLLDLNMPKKDGREVLKEIRQDPQLQHLPVVIFSTTNNEQEMRRCYELGANSYITKPNSFEALVRTVAALRSYWLSPNTLPVNQ